MNPDIPHIISLGGGVQSSTMALMAAHGEITPMPKAAIFADTGDEPQSVYDWLEWLTPRLPFPVHKVQKGVISADSLKIRTSKKTGKKYMKAMIPAFVSKDDLSHGLLGRICTSEYKVEPLLAFAKSIANINRGQKTVGVYQWIGISLDEAHRMKPSRVKWAESIWPLIDKKMTRASCLAWMKRMGYPEPPRSACVYCPFHSDEEWRRLRDFEPLEFAKAVRFEKDLQVAATKQEALRGIPYLTSRCRPLDTIDFDENKPGHEQINMFGNECEGLCGV